MAADRQLALEEALANHEHLLASVFAELCSAEQRAEELHQQLADDQHAAALASVVATLLRVKGDYFVFSFLQAQRLTSAKGPACCKAATRIPTESYVEPFQTIPANLL